jgi:hypothetical protein
MNVYCIPVLFVTLLFSCGSGAPKDKQETLKKEEFSTWIDPKQADPDWEELELKGKVKCLVILKKTIQLTYIRSTRKVNWFCIKG